MRDHGTCRLTRRYPTPKPARSHGTSSPSGSSHALGPLLARGRELAAPFARFASPERRTHEEHRDRRFTHDYFGVAAHQNARKPAAAVSTEHNDIGPPFFRLLDDELRDSVAKRFEQHGLPTVISVCQLSLYGLHWN